MTKQETIAQIEALLQSWRTDDEEVWGVLAEEVFEQMPITLCEMQNGSTAEWSFDDLARVAAHDVFHAEARA